MMAYLTTGITYIILSSISPTLRIPGYIWLHYYKYLHTYKIHKLYMACMLSYEKQYCSTFKIYFNYSNSSYNTIKIIITQSPGIKGALI